MIETQHGRIERLVKELDDVEEQLDLQTEKERKTSIPGLREYDAWYAKLHPVAGGNPTL